MPETCFDKVFKTPENRKKFKQINIIKPLNSIQKKKMKLYENEQNRMEKYEDYMNDVLDFLYQMMQNKNIPIQNRPYISKMNIDNIDELHKFQGILKLQKKKILPIIRQKIAECIIIYNEDKIPEYVFNTTDAKLNSRFKTYINNRNIKKLGIIPFTTPAVSRMYGDILTAHPEFTDSANTYTCGINIDSHTHHFTLNECTIIPKSIYKLYEKMETNQYYIINSQEYTQPSFESYTLYNNKNELIEYYDPYTTATVGPVLSIFLDKVSYVKMAFEEGGVMIIHPRLALLIQIQLPELFNSPYFNTALHYDQVDTIVILTLQKYAAIRRYMWSKDPLYTSEIYKVDPKNIAEELRDPYSLFKYPYENDDSQKNENIPWDTIPYSKTFTDFTDFKNEFIENQRWLSDIRYDSIDDPNLYNILPTRYDRWCLKGEYKSIEQVRIKRIPEFEKFIKNPILYKQNLLKSKKICVCKYKGGKSLKFETRYKKRNTKKRNTKKWIRSR